MNVIERVLLIMGLLLASCALWGGSKLPWDYGPITVAFCLVAGLFATVSYSAFLSHLRRFRRFCETSDALVVALLNAICFSFLFGAIVVPIGQGTDPWAWITPWDFLFVFGFLPLVVVRAVRR